MTIQFSTTHLRRGFGSIQFLPIYVSSDFFQSERREIKNILTRQKPDAMFVRWFTAILVIKIAQEWAFLNQRSQGHRLWWDSILSKKINYLNWYYQRPWKKLPATVTSSFEDRRQEVTTGYFLQSPSTGKVLKTRKLRRIGLSFLIWSFLNNLGCLWVKGFYLSDKRSTGSYLVFAALLGVPRFIPISCGLLYPELTKFESCKVLGKTDRHDNQAGRGRRFPSSSRDWGHEVEW